MRKNIKGGEMKDKKNLGGATKYGKGIISAKQANKILAKIYGENEELKKDNENLRRLVKSYIEKLFAAKKENEGLHVALGKDTAP